MTKRILLRADDLGFSEGVNYGILKAVEQGPIRTVGLMVNMQATQHGYNLIKDKQLCIGLHTNICVGKPISNPRLISSLCQENDEFISSRVYRKAYQAGEDFVDLQQVITEIEAQYHQFISIVGRKPDYFEGHAVASKHFFEGLAYVAKKYQLPYFELAQERPFVQFKNARVYAYIPSSFAEYEENPFLAIKDCIEHAHEEDVDMMVFHPGYLDQYLLSHSSFKNIRVVEAATLSSRSTNRWLTNQKVSYVTYNDL